MTTVNCSICGKEFNIVGRFSDVFSNPTIDPQLGRMAMGAICPSCKATKVKREHLLRLAGRKV